VALQPIRTLVLLRWRQRLFSLYVPVLLKATCAGMVMLLVPFEANRLGGGPTAIGGVGAIWTGSYMVGLLLFGGRVDRFDPRLLVRMGLSVIAAMMFIISAAPNLTVLFLANAVYGMTSGLFWPPIMGWISSGHEGPSLNRRLSLFNVSWSTGMMIGPLLGGWLYETYRVLPFYVGIAWLVAAIVIVTVIRSPEPTSAPGVEANGDDVDGVDVARNAVFRPMARIAHYLTYVIMGVFRFQLPSLAIFLGIRAKGFGPVQMSLSVAMALSFYLLGRSHRWHYRVSVFFAAQVLLILTVLALLMVGTWWQMALCMIVGGACVGVTYSSNLFYGVSGGVRRARRMAIHELLLSAGMVTGSYGAGWITEHIALRAAYPICAALLVVGMLAQVTVFVRRRTAQPVVAASSSS